MSKPLNMCLRIALILAMLFPLAPIAQAQDVDSDEFHFTAEVTPVENEVSAAGTQPAYADIYARVYRKDKRLVVNVTCGNEGQLQITIVSSRVDFARVVNCGPESQEVFKQSNAFAFGDVVKIAGASDRGLSVVKFLAVDAAPVWIGIRSSVSSEADGCITTYGHNDPWVLQSQITPGTTDVIKVEEPRHFEEKDWSFTTTISDTVPFVDVHVVAANKLVDGQPEQIRADYTFEAVPNPCFNPQPDFVLRKLINGADANDENGVDVPMVQADSILNLRFDLTNTGNIDLPIDQIVLTDTQSGVTPVLDAETDVNGGVLKPGQTIIYTATVQALNLETASASQYIIDGCDPSGTGLTRKAHRDIATAVLWEITRSDPAHYCNPERPAIEMNKYIQGQDADDPNDPAVPVLEPGSDAELTVVVTNTGNVILLVSEIYVTDNQPGVGFALDPSSDALGDGLLHPGETLLYRTRVTAVNTLTDLTSGEIVPGCDPRGTGMVRNAHRDIATAYVRGIVVHDPAHYCNPRNPGIEVSGLLKLKVTDIGNTRLTSVRLATAIINCPQAPDLAPGETVDMNCSIEVRGSAFDGYLTVVDTFTTLEGISEAELPACTVQPRAGDVGWTLFLPLVTSNK